MKFGIKQKVLLVLVGVLALTTALHALLASYYTNRQNQESAFATLDRDLLAWQNDLQELTLHLKDVALSASDDPILLNQLAEVVSLELNVDGPQRMNDAEEMAKTLSYSKAVSLNRLHLVLRTSGFSSIAVYTNSKLSHYVSATDAGMATRRTNGQPMWLQADTHAAGKWKVENWPAWQEGRPPSTVAQLIAEVRQPEVSFVFPSPDVAAIEVVIPVQGVIEEFLRDGTIQPLARLVSELTIASPADTGDQSASKQQPRTFAVLVFRKLIDRPALQAIAAKTGKWPALISPDGSHQQQLADFRLTPKDLLQKAQAIGPGNPPQIMSQTVITNNGSFYEAVLPFQFENQTRLILSLASSRHSTLQNIRQTVTALLIAASLILVLSIGVGTFWVRRIIDPIVALTNAVKRIGLKRRTEACNLVAAESGPMNCSPSQSRRRMKSAN